MASSEFEAGTGENPPYGILEGAEETKWRVWWPFATMPERADTLEAIDLIMFAPLLYSMGEFEEALPELAEL